ncbi:MAG: preprotein translocase subunit SecG [Gemmataceae bacterium]
MTFCNLRLDRIDHTPTPGAGKDVQMTSVLTPLWAAPPSWVPLVLDIVLALTGLFLIVLVLIQRGKGGGLAGAFGGAGGSSAFGSRAGDTFTRITIYTAAIWILLIMFMIKLTQDTTPLKDSGERIQVPQPGEEARSNAPIGRGRRAARFKASLARASG